MKKLLLLLMCCSSLLGIKAQAANALPEDLFKGGKAQYDKVSNTLTLEEGFLYSVSKGLVAFETGSPLTIVLKGNAAFKAAIVCSDDLVIEAASPATLSFIANISGSALTCPNLTVKQNVTLNMLSRNSPTDMHALACNGTLTIDRAALIAETTTANLAVQVKELVLWEAAFEKPKGAIVNPDAGGICFGDGIPAKIVRIKPVLKD